MSSLMCALLTVFRAGHWDNVTALKKPHSTHELWYHGGHCIRRPSGLGDVAYLAGHLWGQE